MNKRIKSLRSSLLKHRFPIIAISCFIVFAISSIYFFVFQQRVSMLTSKTKQLDTSLSQTKKELQELKLQDQYVINKKLKDTIQKIETTYKKAVSSYEKLLDLKSVTQKTEKFDNAFAEALSLLSQRNYATAEAKLADLNKSIDDERTKLASEFTIPQNIQTSNSLPSSGYGRQQVSIDVGNFLVDIISADLNSTRVIIDTASDSDCSNNCPTLSLGEYAARSGAFAAVNGSFFCPAEYPSCSGKTNSFDTLLMNKNKHYFNSDNNKYSTVPLAYFSGNSMGVRSQSLNWGRDTGVDGVIANFPLYVEGGQNRFGGSGDPKISNKGTRTFVGNKGSSVYIGIIYNASAEDAAKVLITLKLDNALGLDQGGSTALWYAGSYKAGPGRNIPNAVLFVRK